MTAPSSPITLPGKRQIKAADRPSRRRSLYIASYYALLHSLKRVGAQTNGLFILFAGHLCTLIQNYEIYRKLQKEYHRPATDEKKWSTLRWSITLLGALLSSLFEITKLLDAELLTAHYWVILRCFFIAFSLVQGLWRLISDIFIQEVLDSKNAGLSGLYRIRQLIKFLSRLTATLVFNLKKVPALLLPMLLENVPFLVFFSTPLFLWQFSLFFLVYKLGMPFFPKIKHHPSSPPPGANNNTAARVSSDTQPGSDHLDSGLDKPRRRPV